MRVADELVLVASTRSVRFAESYSARVTETLSEAEACGFIVRFAERDVPFKVALIVAVVAPDTRPVLTVKFADEAPAGTVRLSGTVAAELLLDSWTVVAVWTLALSFTVPVEEFPPVTELGFKVTDETVAEGAGGGAGVAAPVEFIKTSKPLLLPRTARAISGLPSTLKSPEISAPPPWLD